ncbi:MAG: pili assembly chaperone [Magnetococcales bacterium]|nr:pili assembly chaperone [Magnetococcales bacterium]NGZ25387.1 pili assembly chaperone [Magnetococcales bacterium]
MKSGNVVKVQYAVALMLVGIAILLPETAMAGTGGTEFQDVYDMIEGWSKGYLGRILSMGMFVVGVAQGVIKQSVGAVVPGVGAAAALYYGPSVVSGVVTGTF